MQKRGVEHLRIDALQQGRRLDNFLVAHFGSMPKSRIYQMIRRGEVRVNGGRVRPEHRLAGGDEVRLPPVSLQETPAAAGAPSRILTKLSRAILHEDASLLVIDKPAGIPVHSGSGQEWGIIDAVRQLYPGEAGLQLAHRLDRDTSGCLLVARDYQRLRSLHDQLREGRIRKRYTALLQGNLGRADFSVDAPLDREARVRGERTVRPAAGGQASLSRFRVIRRYPAATLVTVEIATGRTHQIRAHARHIGHPVAGDDRYGNREFNRTLRRCGLKRQFLHAACVVLPGAGRGTLTVESPLPEDLERVLLNLAAPAGAPVAGSSG
jgi:23S rRNA pseudouridine955/2504/2580 synthase